jgi:hypothetical protein
VVIKQRSFLRSNLDQGHYYHGEVEIMDRIILTDKDAQGITINGKPIPKPDKVMATIEEALLLSPIEWIE